MAQFIVTARGYYKDLLEPGDVFDGPADMKGSWFEALNPTKASEKASSKLADLPIADLRIMAQNKGVSFDKKTTKAELAEALSVAPAIDEDEDLA